MPVITEVGKEEEEETKNDGSSGRFSKPAQQPTNGDEYVEKSQGNMKLLSEHTSKYFDIQEIVRDFDKDSSEATMVTPVQQSMQKLFECRVYLNGYCHLMVEMTKFRPPNSNDASEKLWTAICDRRDDIVKQTILLNDNTAKFFGNFHRIRDSLAYLYDNYKAVKKNPEIPANEQIRSAFSYLNQDLNKFKEFAEDLAKSSRDRFTKTEQDTNSAISSALAKAGGSKNYEAQRQIIQESDASIENLLKKIDAEYEANDENIMKLQEEINSLDIKKTQVELILGDAKDEINMISQEHNKLRKKMTEIRNNAMTTSNFEDKLDVEIDFLFIWRVKRQRHETGKKKNLLESVAILEQKTLKEWNQLKSAKLDKVEKATQLKMITEDLKKKKTRVGKSTTTIVRKNSLFICRNFRFKRKT
jgi:hypothetical protein